MLQRSQPAETTPDSEVDPASAPDATHAEPSGAQNNGEVRVHLVRSAPAAHRNSCSEKLGDYHHTRLIFHFPVQCRYPRGFVVVVQTTAVERIKEVDIQFLYCHTSLVVCWNTLFLHKYLCGCLLSRTNAWFTELPVPDHSCGPS